MTVDPLATLSLWNSCCTFDQLTDAVFLEKTSGDPDWDENLLKIEYVEGVPIGFCFAVARSGKDEFVGHVKLLAVDPSYRGRGIGSSLLQQIENEFSRNGVKKVRLGEAAPNYLNPGIDPRYTAAMLFFRNRGYERFGEAYNMSVDLGALPVAPVVRDSTIEVRRANSSDRESVDGLLKTYWPSWISEVSNSFEREPISLHIAIRDGTLLGFSAYDCNNVGTGWFGPMGTAPEARGSGIGATLLHHCLSDLKMSGLETATIPWVAPIGFYSKFVGASISRVFYRFEKSLSS